MTTRLPLCCLGCLETPSDRKHLGVQGLGQGRETPALSILPAPSFPNFAEPQMWQDQAPLLLSSETLTPGWGSSPCPAGWRLQSHLLNTVHVPRVFFFKAFFFFFKRIEKQTHTDGGVGRKIPGNF